MIRGPYSHEPGRLEICLLGMQGLGGPGVHQHQLTYFGMPKSKGLSGTFFWNPEIHERLAIPVMGSVAAWQKQVLPKTLIQKAIESDEPIVFHGAGAQEGLVQDQFEKYTYPIPKEEGGCEIHMMWTDTPCRTTCWNYGNETDLALRNPKIEFILSQHPWLENDCLFSDIILPSNTHMEVDDIVTNIRMGTQIANVAITDRAIDPIGESMSNYEVVVEVAKKMGLEDAVTENTSTEEMKRSIFESSARTSGESVRKSAPKTSPAMSRYACQVMSSDFPTKNTVGS